MGFTFIIFFCFHPPKNNHGNRITSHQETVLRKHKLEYLFLQNWSIQLICYNLIAWPKDEHSPRGIYFPQLSSTHSSSPPLSFLSTTDNSHPLFHFSPALVRSLYCLLGFAERPLFPLQPIFLFIHSFLAHLGNRLRAILRYLITTKHRKDSHMRRNSQKVMLNNLKPEPSQES